MINKDHLDDEFEIKLSGRHLDIVHKSLDLFSRLLCGQLGEIESLLRYYGRLNNNSNYSEVNSKIEELRTLLYNDVSLHSNVTSVNVGAKAAEISFEFYKVIGNFIHIKINESDDKSVVDNDVPFSYSGIKLPKIRKSKRGRLKDKIRNIK